MCAGDTQHVRQVSRQESRSLGPECTRNVTTGPRAGDERTPGPHTPFRASVPVSELPAVQLGSDPDRAGAGAAGAQPAARSPDRAHRQHQAKDTLRQEGTPSGGVTATRAPWPAHPRACSLTRQGRGVPPGSELGRTRGGGQPHCSLVSRIGEKAGGRRRKAAEAPPPRRRRAPGTQATSSRTPPENLVWETHQMGLVLHDPTERSD